MHLGIVKLTKLVIILPYQIKLPKIIQTKVQFKILLIKLLILTLLLYNKIIKNHSQILKVNRLNNLKLLILLLKFKLLLVNYQNNIIKVEISKYTIKA